MADQITIKIDGKECRGEKGQTILEVAKANGIDIPTLCHHPWLSNHGACRMCVVEVEGGRRLVTACAAPAVDGQSIIAHNEKLSAMRQMTLELLFAERNHICPFCPSSGVCELQDRSYDEGITHTRYTYLFPVLDPDTSNPYFVQDHNRCILCGRCIRACEEVVGVGTLGFGYRGSKELVIADLGVPLGESSCISCGTCVDVCPTGALFDKRAPYFCKERGLERKRAVCPSDDMGCVMNVVLKSGLVARVEGCTDPADAPVNGPLLSAESRYEILNEPTPRLLGPLVRNEAGELAPVSWDEALDRAASLLAKAAGSGQRIAGLCAGRLPAETLEAFGSFLKDSCGTTDIDTLAGAERLTKRAAIDLYGQHEECDFEAIKAADLVLMVGFDPMATHPVLGAWLAGKRHHHQTPVISINSRPGRSADLASLAIQPRRGAEQTVVLGLLCQLLEVGGLARKADRETQERWQAHPADRVAVEARVAANDVIRAAKLYAAAKNPVILYGPDLAANGNPTVIGMLWEMARLSGHYAGGDALAVRGFSTEANAAAAESLGFRGADVTGAGLVYLLAGDDPLRVSTELDEGLEEVPALILQASHESDLMEYAAVVLPSLKWSERGGTWINVCGLKQTFEACTTPPAGVKADEAVLAELAGRVAPALKEAT